MNYFEGVRQKMTRQEYDAKMAALEPATQEQRKAITCSLLGHSLIVTQCFGYIYCARCGTQLGDQWISGYENAPHAVFVGHNCAQCRCNYAALGWEHKVLCPDPFEGNTP